MLRQVRPSCCPVSRAQNFPLPTQAPRRKALPPKSSSTVLLSCHEGTKLPLPPACQALPPKVMSDGPAVLSQGLQPVHPVTNTAAPGAAAASSDLLSPGSSSHQVSKKQVISMSKCKQGKTQEIQEEPKTKTEEKRQKTKTEERREDKD